MKHYCPECCDEVETPNDEDPIDCIDHIPLDVLLERCENPFTPHDQMYRAMDRLHDALKKRR